METLGKLAITIRSFNREGAAMTRAKKYFDISYINETGSRLSGDSLAEAIKDADAVIAGTEIFSNNILSTTNHLTAISRVGVGLDSIDLEAASKKGIKVLNTPLSPVQSVAEHTLTLLLSILKHIPQYNESARKLDHSIKPGYLLCGKIVGIIGLGRVGHQVAELLDCLGCSIIFYDPFLSIPPPARWKRVMTLDDLLEQAEIITLHAAPQSGQAPLLDEQSFKKCRKGLCIINTARGSLINEEALINALNENVVAAAGLDVFSHEPYNGPLLKFPQVVITPHVASNTIEVRKAMESEAVDNLIRFLGA